MSDDKLEAARKRMADTMKAASHRLAGGLGGTPTKHSTSNAGQMRLQASEHDTFASAHLAQATPLMQSKLRSERPPAPTGRWRCIVNSEVVSIDLTTSIAANGTLSGQGTIIYVATYKVYNVAGQGDWTLLPPDTEAPNWLFKFRLHPSNHAIFSWFAGPTDSPNHLANRFVAPTGHTVITRCERMG